MKIKVTKEGREGCFLITKEEAIKLVKNIKSETIHHQFQGSSMMIGADWNTESVLEHLENQTEKIAIVIEANFNLGHHLVTICNSNKRNAFDIGKITEEYLIIKQEEKEEKNDIS